RVVLVSRHGGQVIAETPIDDPARLAEELLAAPNAAEGQQEPTSVEQNHGRNRGGRAMSADLAKITAALPAEVVDRLRGAQPREQWLTEAALRLARKQTGFDPLEPVG